MALRKKKHVKNWETQVLRGNFIILFLLEKSQINHFDSHFKNLEKCGAIKPNVSHLK